MKIRNVFTLAVMLLAAFVLLLPLRRTAAQGDEVDIIVNKSNNIPDLTIGDAKKIFLGEKTTWPNGKRITILMLAQGQPERAVVLRDIYKMSEGDYSKYFLQAAFTGKVTAPPKEVSSGSQVKQFIADNPGAIGYIKVSDVDETTKVVLRLH